MKVVVPFKALKNNTLGSPFALESLHCAVLYLTRALKHVLSCFLRNTSKNKQEGQVALKRSPDFCLKLTYRYL